MESQHNTFISENGFENAVSKIAAILSRPECAIHNVINYCPILDQTETSPAPNIPTESIYYEDVSNHQQFDCLFDSRLTAKALTKATY